ncbi:Hypothetical predicted protein [Paramuricea clavata]|uniref:Uncharacterized protein n=1 Tax=Paramuricea clavata TaxID=317549 RepID=A0A7D9ETX6_PARCT|nr:Hypothetical predicted protein [Paramuricea clavata]
MSCSNEVRIPSNWAFLEKEVLKEQPDPELVDIDGLIKWVVECEIADENMVRKYVKIVRPYYFARLLYPILPNNRLCREAFKIFLHFVIAVYRCDDRMETECDLNDMGKICNAYDKLDEQLCETFPKIPTVKEMQSSLKFLSEAKLIAPVTLCMDFVNKVTCAILTHGSVSEDVVFEFRRRLSNSVSIYLKAVKSEKNMTPEDSDNETLWRRIFGGGPLFLLLYVEISSFSLGKTKEFIPTITEMYVVSSLCCIITNDVYSYYRETTESLIYCDSIIKVWLHNKEITTIPEAIARITNILNATVKYMFEMGKNVKIQYPNSPEVHALFEYIAYATIGWMFMHDQGSHRYRDSPWRISLVDVKEIDLQQNKDSYGEDVLKTFLEMSNSKAKKIIDALRGVIAVREDLIYDNC